MARRAEHGARSRCAQPSPDPGQDRALAPNIEEPNLARELLSAGRSRSPHRPLRRALQSPALSRELEESDARRCLLRTRSVHLADEREDQTKNYQESSLATSKKRGINSTNGWAILSSESSRLLSQ